MSRILSTFFAGTLLASTAACPVKAETPKPSFVEDGVFTICTDATFPPMEFVETAGASDPVGFDIDLANALAEHWGANSRVIVSDFSGLLPGLQAQRCDAVISGIYLTPERLESYHGVPYLSTSVTIFTNAKSDLDISDPTDLSGKVVAVQEGTNYVDRMLAVNETLKAAGKEPMTLQTYPDQTDVIQQVLLQRADAAVSQDTELAYRELQNPGQFKPIYVFPEASEYAVYIRPDDEDRAAVRAAVRELAEGGQLPDIAREWKLPAENVIAGGES